MHFNKRKLPKEAAESLRLCPIHTVKPFALMMAPVYLFMKLNEKFVAIKAPLDFFTPEELERLKTFESFFFTPFVDSSTHYRDAARSIRKLLQWDPMVKIASKNADVVHAKLPPTSYEVSDAVLRILGKLWWKEGDTSPFVEPFFVTVFANELCEALPEEVLRSSRDGDVDGFERAILFSSWAVFFALHFGHCDLGYINRLRQLVFEAMVRRETDFSGMRISRDIVSLLELVRLHGDAAPHQRISGEIFKNSTDRGSQRLTARLERIREHFAQFETPAPTIFGEGGFVDV